MYYGHYFSRAGDIDATATSKTTFVYTDLVSMQLDTL